MITNSSYNMGSVTSGGCGTSQLPGLYEYDWDRTTTWPGTRTYPNPYPWQTITIHQEEKATMNEAQIRELREKAMSMAIDSLKGYGIPTYDDRLLKQRAKTIFKFLKKSF